MTDYDTNLSATAEPAGPRKIVIRIASGSRANQVEELPIEGRSEVVLGRDPGVAVKFDPERDDLVSREHAKIVWDDDGETFRLEDLGSSNGTLHNGTRISEPVRLRPDDSIQLGAGGPKVVFDLDPRPETVPATRLAAAMPPPTRQAATFDPPPQGTGAAAAGSMAGTAAAGIPPTGASTAPPAPPAASPPMEPHRPAVGRETVERLVAHSERQSGRRIQFVGLAVALVAVVAAIAFYLIRRETGGVIAETERKIDDVVSAQPMSPAEIADRYSASTVFVDVTWTLVQTETGEELYHYYDRGLPTYVRLPDGSIEPMLYTEGQNTTNEKIIDRVSGTGFVVTDDGFILTNRHVVAGWRSVYDLPLPGRLFEWDAAKSEVLNKGVLEKEDRSKVKPWIPSKAAFLKTQRRSLVGQVAEGRHISLYVTFPKSTLRIPARVVRVSDVHDVALIKIDLPNPVNPVEPYDNYETIRAGEPVSVLGYPTVSPGAGVSFTSLDALDRSSERRQVPDPTLSTGVIGRVHRSTAAPVGDERFDFWTEVGDAYQMTIDTAGRGNSGGPVFDDRGRAIGIYTYIRTIDNATVSFAVPIRYGQDLMKIAPVLR